MFVVVFYVSEYNQKYIYMCFLLVWRKGFVEGKFQFSVSELCVVENESVFIKGGVINFCKKRKNS